MASTIYKRKKTFLRCEDLKVSWGLKKSGDRNRAFVVTGILLDLEKVTSLSCKRFFWIFRQRQCILMKLCAVCVISPLEIPRILKNSSVNLDAKNFFQLSFIIRFFCISFFNLILFPVLCQGKSPYIHSMKLNLMERLWTVTVMISSTCPHSFVFWVPFIL